MTRYVLPPNSRTVVYVKGRAIRPGTVVEGDEFKKLCPPFQVYRAGEPKEPVKAKPEIVTKPVEVLAEVAEVVEKAQNKEPTWKANFQKRKKKAPEPPV